jgi:hypothetical protein
LAERGETPQEMFRISSKHSAKSGAASRSTPWSPLSRAGASISPCKP